jgi:hypothetical protein
MLDYKHRIIQNPAEGLVTSPGITFVSSTTNMLLFNPSRPVRIVRWGVVIMTTATDAGSSHGLKFTCNTYTAAAATGTQVTGSTTSFGGASTGYNASNNPVFYIDTAGGSLSVPNSVLAAGLAVGTVLWHNVNPQVSQTGGYYPAADTALIPPGGVNTGLVIYPGQSCSIQCADIGSTAGAGKIWLEVEEQPFVVDYNNNQYAVTGYPANGTTPTPSNVAGNTMINYQS